MQRVNSEVVYSASDLVQAARCEYAFLRKLDEHLEIAPPAEFEQDLLHEHASRLGDLHEERILHRFTDQLGVGSFGELGGWS